MSGSALEVLSVFLKLGLTSFGGPIAHLGYFRAELVVRRRWLDERTYGDIVALCQSLPGPSSSQVGFAIGLLRAGYGGALAAWTGFTLPSALALVAFAYGLGVLAGPTGTAVLHGLKLVAVAIVAQAVWGMARQFCVDAQRAAIAVGAGMIVWLGHASLAQLAAIAFGAVTGWWLCNRAPGASSQTSPLDLQVTRRAAVACLGWFLGLLLALPLLTRLTGMPGAAPFAAFYRSGALVFGGGHVVLPLLHEAFVTPGWVSNDEFLAGYGAAQALPGPLFTFGAYLGVIEHPAPNGIAGALLGLLGIFLPGMLILLAALPFWAGFRRQSHAQAVLEGVNAAVVGLLAAALYDPIFKSSVHTAGDFGLALGAFLLLSWARTSPLVVVILAALVQLVRLRM